MNVDSNRETPRISISTPKNRPSLHGNILANNFASSGSKPVSLKPAHFLPTGTILAKNSFCETSLVSEKGSQTILVMKKIDKSFFNKRKVLNSFEKEIEVHLGINHPNIIRLFHKLEDAESFYIICEYASKGNFFNYMKEKKKLTEEEAFPVFMSCCLAIDHLFQKNVNIRTLNLERILRSGDNFKFSAFSFDDFLQIGSPQKTNPDLEIDTDINMDNDSASLQNILIKLGKLLMELLSGRASMRTSIIKPGRDESSRQSCYQKVEISDNCKSLLSLLLESKSDNTISITEILKSDWVVAMCSQLKIDVHSFILPPDISNNITTSVRRSSCFVTPIIPRTSVFLPPKGSNTNTLSSFNQNSDIFIPSIKAHNSRSPIKKTDWHKKKTHNENIDISMSSSRFFDKKLEGSDKNSKNMRKMNFDDKSFLRKIAEVLGCTTRG